MSKADVMFKELGYEVSNSKFVEELDTTTNTVVDKSERAWLDRRRG